MARYAFYIDGFNVYYALQQNPHYRKYKWLDYRKLAETAVGAKDEITGVFYFTAFVGWKPRSVSRHKAYIRALRSAGVETVLGRFMEKHVKCHSCHQFFTTHEEKQSDVNIALKLVTDAVEDLYDKALIVSADSDLIPAISSIQRLVPDKEIGVMFPIGRNSYELLRKAAFRLKMSQKLLRDCQFPDEIKVGSTIIERPKSWR